jgi:hypothetical protein
MDEHPPALIATPASEPTTLRVQVLEAERRRVGRVRVQRVASLPAPETAGEPA